MANKAELQARVNAAKRELAAAEGAMAAWEDQAENNVFDTLDLAVSAIESALLDLAGSDCEGAHNCGAETYTREFIVDGVIYVGTLTCEYNRLDKTYYFIE